MRRAAKLMDEYIESARSPELKGEPASGRKFKDSEEPN